jgi:hypothetical protein
VKYVFLRKRLEFVHNMDKSSEAAFKELLEVIPVARIAQFFSYWQV